MTKLDDTQERDLETIRQLFQANLPVLEKLRQEYEYAVYRAKKPIVDAIEEAREDGIPMRRITEISGLFKYPQQLEKWMAPDETVIARLEEGGQAAEVAETFSDQLDNAETVTRDARTGVISVHHFGTVYEVPAYGSEYDIWTPEDPEIPVEVYELIKDKFPGFVALGEED